VKLLRRPAIKYLKKAISEKIAELREEYGEEEETPLADFVKRKYPERLAEIEKDPIAWIMTRTKEIVGYDRLKLLTFLSLVSTRMERLTGDVENTHHVSRRKWRREIVDSEERAKVR